MVNQNPYTRLKEAFKTYVQRVNGRKILRGFFYSDSTGAASVPELIARTKTANDLGYDLITSVEKEILYFKYQQRVDTSTPYELY